VGDLQAQISACRIGERRVSELSASLGRDIACATSDELLNQAERQTRAALAVIPPGTYICSDCLDNDGAELDKPVPIKVAVTVDRDRFHVDFRQHGPADARSG